MELVVVNIDAYTDSFENIPQELQTALRKERADGNLIWIATEQDLRYAKKNFYKIANGYIVKGGKEGYTCCSKVFTKVNDPAWNIIDAVKKIAETLHIAEGQIRYYPDYTIL